MIQELENRTIPGEDIALFSGVPSIVARGLLSKEEGSPADCTLVVVEPGAGSMEEPHIHQHDHIFFIIEGIARIRLDKDHYTLTGGQAIHIPGETPHSIINIGSAELRVFSICI